MRYFVLALLSFVTVAVAQEKTTAPPASSATEQAVPVPKPEPREPITVITPPRQMICQPKTAQCISCSEDDPCYLYGITTRPIAKQ